MVITFNAECLGFSLFHVGNIGEEIHIPYQQAEDDELVDKVLRLKIGAIISANQASVTANHDIP